VKHPPPSKPATPAAAPSAASSSAPPKTAPPAVPKPVLGARPLPSRPFTPPPLAPKATPTTTKPVTEAQLLAIAGGTLTWAEAMGMTRQEAFGLAQSAYRFFEFGQREKGQGIMAALIELNPKVPAFHALMGAMHGRQGRESEALGCYSTAIGLEPLNLSARVNRAELFLKTGAIDQALDDLIAATKADPQQKTPLGKRAWRLAKTTSQALKELIARSPGSKSGASSSSAAAKAPARPAPPPKR